MQRRGLLRGQISDEIDDLGGGHAFLGDGARELGHLGDQRPVSRKRGGQFVICANGTVFDASKAPVPGLSTLANGNGRRSFIISRKIAIHFRVEGDDPMSRQREKTLPDVRAGAFGFFDDVLQCVEG